MIAVFLLLLHFFLVDMLKHEKPVAELLWRGRCTQHARVLNDCNWCHCDRTHRYTCNARSCSEVDMFGHFNDAIQDLDVGMEGHGSWRSSELACEPGVEYRRGGLLCVCTGEGTWPNPVCRDVFRILHSVEVTGDSEVTGQKCSATKLYLIGCNVCFCPSSQKLDPLLCTTLKCSDKDPVMLQDTASTTQQSENNEVEIYAECQPDQKYKLGCKTCVCMRNNRLHCGNCSSDEKEKSVRSFCQHSQPGQTFSRDCNLCYCDKKGFAYCTSKKCLPLKVESLAQYIASSKKTDDVFDEENCIPGRTYKRDCNECYCFLKDGQKYFGCTLSRCVRAATTLTTIQMDCVKGTVYELNCLICHCEEIKGMKAQLCYVNPRCTKRLAAREAYDLDHLHGYCEPLHVYRKGCNTCHCLSDGKTVRCTSYECDKDAQEPVAVDIVPVTQKATPCPKGLSYKIDCNFCFCLPNGNALCTTADCRDSK